MKHSNSKFLSKSVRDQFYGLILLSFSHLDEFTLTQVNKIVLPMLSHLHPETTTMDASIRAILQKLRDENKIKFIRRGVYSW